MQIQVDIGFDELLEIIKNLPKDQLMRLKMELEVPAKRYDGEEFGKLLLNGPTFSEEQFKIIEESRNALK